MMSKASSTLPEAREKALRMLSNAVQGNMSSANTLKEVEETLTAGNIRFLSGAEEQRLRKALQVWDEKIKQDRLNENQARKERNEEGLPDLGSSVFGDHLTPLIVLCMNTGLRLGELLHLRWGNVDFDWEVLIVPGIDMTGGKTCSIPLNTETLSTLSAWKNSRTAASERIFCAPDGKPLEDQQENLAALLKEAEILDGMISVIMLPVD
jgi:integrase